MGKVRIHFRLSNENYDYLCEFSREHYDLGLNKALNACLDEVRLKKQVVGQAAHAVGHVASKLAPSPKKS